MKKLLTLVFVLALTACSTPAEKNTSESTITPVTFEQQLQLEGIEFTYSDPNAGIYDFTSTDTSVDVQTGASGNPLYVNDEIAPTIRTAQDLVNRKSVKYSIYEWVEDESGVSTLEEAAQLEDAQYVSALFPNDGKKYIIKASSNSIGTCVLSTVNAQGEPNAAVFGMNFINDENDSSRVLLSGSIMAYTESVANILNGSPILVTYYEYNPTTSLKMGVGSRNAGARVECVLDKDLTMVNGTKQEGDEKAPSMSLAEYEALSAEEQEAFGMTSLGLRAEVVNVYSIG